MKHFTYSILTALILLAGLNSCQQDESIYTPQPTPKGEGCSLSFISDPLQELKVSTRSSDPKNDDEKRINYLYVFFFGSDGNYLEGGYLEGYGNAPEQGGYYAPGEGVTTLKISNEIANFTNPDLAKSATVYAVANVDPSLFSTLDDNGRPSNITKLSDLENFVYKPSGTLSVGLPTNGMPMAGKKTKLDLTSTTNEADRTIDLKALMARIDVTLQLNSDITDNQLPSMLLTRWTVKNAPTQVTFNEPTDNTSETSLSADTKTDVIGSERTQQIYNKQGSIAFTFYIFENRQNATSTSFDYPEGIEEYQKQRYKPQLANDNATYVEMQSEYTTYNNATYSVTYKLYLGSNHTDNFQVKRNHQYKNDITIKGLLGRDYEDTGTDEDEKYTFDARVNVSEEENKYYIAMLRERNHDAHFCVTPMDVYLFDETNNPTMEVIVGEVAEGSEEATNVPDWIRMEKIKAADMEQGTVSESGFTAYNENTNEGTHLATGTAWTAGNGKRAFFTTSLLNELSSKVTIEHTRDRVYFYIDENLQHTDRTATVTLIYKENGAEVSRRTVEIGQVHLLPVTYTETQDGGDNQTHTIYMEQYEEYLDHYDPLDEHLTNQIYEGLPWAVAGTTLATSDIGTLYYEINSYSSSAYNQSYNNYYDGLAYTSYVVMDVDKQQQRMTLNDQPLSAFQYCHNKNKRNASGIVPATYRDPLIGSSYRIEQSNESKWFLPAITQMEEALETYYTTYPEFQTDYYWSASAAKEGWSIGENEDGDRARATRVLSNGNHVSSDQQTSSMYPNGGNTPRTQPLRIRAFRIDLNKPTY